MKHTLKVLNYLLLAGAMTFASCGENKSETTETTDSTATTDQMGTDSTQAGADNNADQNFVNDATELNMKEMAWLKAGVALGTDKEVKAHAKHMLADHEKTGMQMKELAGKKSMQLPTVDTAGEVSMNDEKGKDWDKKWADKMVDDHEKTISRFESAQNEVKDAELKDMISKTLPTLRSHLEMAKKLKDRLDK